MSDPLRQLLPYLPPGLARAYLGSPAAAWPAPPAWENLEAAVLFADVSGFTPLTEGLARRGAEGSEELTFLLNRYFGSMIELLDAEGGEVVKFSGDALTVLFPAGTDPLGHAVRRAAQAAEALQRAMASFAVTATSVGPINLALKIGIGAGAVRIFQVGGAFGRWEYVVAGDPLPQVAAAENQAQPGDVVLSPEAAALIWPEPLPARPLAGPPLPAPAEQPALLAAMRGYVPAAVRGWLSVGLHDWAAVLRPMSVLFCGIGGLDYAAPDALDGLQRLLHAAQTAIYRYEGSINKLAVDDKGTVLLVLFGAPPLAHEDDPARALQCAMDLQAVATAQGLNTAIGVTTGLVFAGPVGGPTRREYTVMGDTVNLAARLMSYAGARQVCCDAATARAAQRVLAFEQLPTAKIKGKAEPVPIFRPLGRASATKTASRTLIGRRAELARIEGMLDAVQSGASRVLVLYGEAGIGKSHLLREIQRLLAARGLRALAGSAISTEQASPYRAWRDIVAQALDLNLASAVEARHHQLQAWSAAVAPDLAERLALLNAVLPLDLPESELIAPLAPSERHYLRIQLLIELLRRRFVGPLVLLIEDAQWLDSLSGALALALARALAAAHAPLLLVLAMRPLDPEASAPELRALLKPPETVRLTLTPLDDQATVALAAARLGLPRTGLPPEVAALVRDRAEGNPFFAEELVLALRDRGLIAITDERPARAVLSVALAQIAEALPSTIQGVVLSRIDRLLPEQQLTLRVGAVIGRHFSYPPLLATLEPIIALGEQSLHEWLLALVRHDMTLPEAAEDELRYLFKQSLTRDVAYNSLLFAQRRSLHRSVAQWYERTYGQASRAPYASLLAYHWGQAEEPEGELAYLTLAGEQAFQSHALREACTFFSQALARLRDLALSDPTREAELARQLGLALWYAGRLDAAREQFAVSSALARAAGAGGALSEALCYLGRVYTEIGDYGAARSCLAEALSLANAANDAANLLLALRYLGVLALLEGSLAEAAQLAETAFAQARATADRFAEVSLLILRGTLALQGGLFAESAEYYQAALQLSQALGHRWSEAIILTNQGELAARRGDMVAAHELSLRSLAIDRAIGNSSGAALTLINLADMSCAGADPQAAAGYLREALPLSVASGSDFTTLCALYVVARLQALSAAPAAAALLAMVLAHPACSDDLRGQAQALLEQLGASGPAPGALPQLDEVVAAAEQWLAAQA